MMSNTAKDDKTVETARIHALIAQNRAKSPELIENHLICHRMRFFLKIINWLIQKIISVGVVRLAVRWSSLEFAGVRWAAFSRGICQEIIRFLSKKQIIEFIFRKKNDCFPKNSPRKQACRELRVRWSSLEFAGVRWILASADFLTFFCTFHISLIFFTVFGKTQ